MAPVMIHPELVQVALDKVNGHDFEAFTNQFYSAIAGTTFVPLGGNKDGGADAYDERIYESSNGRNFFQASIERSPEAKIRRTVKRLHGFGREPRTVVYITSRVVKHIDQLEERLTDELDVNIKIRDGAYIRNHINYSPQTRAAFEFHLKHLTAYLSSPGASGLIPRSRHIKSPAVYVFLSQEVARRAGNLSLVNAVADSLALWALEGTDPDQGILRSAGEVLERICQELPSVRPLLEPIIQGRLEYLARKKSDGSREVRWHRKDNIFCLPHEARNRIEEENLADEALRLSVLAGFEDRIREDKDVSLNNDEEVRLGAEVMLRALQFAFEREGLEFARFLEDEGGGDFATISESVKEALDWCDVVGGKAVRVGAAVISSVRRVLYSSTEAERIYLAKLSRTYTLLFMLNSEPRLVDFFQDLAGDLRLYVGSDVLIRALSENCLAKPDQMTRTTLEMARHAGAKLVLAEPVLDELVSHLRAADWEYRNNYRQIEAHVDYNMARNVPKIMLRAYLYSRLDETSDGRRPPNWESFVGHFCSYVDLHRSFALEDMRRYLQAEYGFEFESTATLLSLVDEELLDSLTGRLLSAKGGNFVLARNDGLMALAVYGSRQRNQEDSVTSEFGYKTWWLTSETAIVRATIDIVRSKKGARYMMRPDFLLNFLALAPNAAEVRQTFSSVFPSMLGITLSKRMRDESFKEIMDQVRQAAELSEGRRTAAIARLSDQLKSDLYRQFTTPWSSQAESLRLGT